MQSKKVASREMASNVFPKNVASELNENPVRVQRGLHESPMGFSVGYEQEPGVRAKYSYLEY